MRWHAHLGTLASVALVVQCGPLEESREPAPSLYPSLVGLPAPPLEGALTWFNSPALTLDELRGKVVLLHFFDYSCVNCIRTYPYLREWNRRYASHGLQIIGVHSPQYDFSTDPANVLPSVRRYNLAYPIAVDSHLKVADVYTNQFWPRVLLVDREGRVRYDHTGEGAYGATETMLQTLLREISPAKSFPTVMEPVHDFDRVGAVCYPITQEIYLGHARGQLANPEGIPTNSIVRLRLPADRAEGKVYAHGAWIMTAEYLRHAVDQEHLEDCLVLKYRATELNIVMKPEGIYWMEVFVDQDGQPIPKSVAGSDIYYDSTGRSIVRVDSPRMYNIIAKQPYGVYEARISVRGQGLSVYSFSFGTCVIPRDAATLRTSKEN
ncbi:MAG: Protein DipZ [Verrucomicrobiae bacterium]|nr:Protein DipZ [Verrucomicrobiae bacterium]